MNGLEQQLGSVGYHLMLILGGSTGIGILSHALNTIPPIKNPWGRWVVGIIQFIIGQRTAAAKTINGATPEVQK